MTVEYCNLMIEAINERIHDLECNIEVANMELEDVRNELQYYTERLERAIEMGENDDEN